VTQGPLFSLPALVALAVAIFTFLCVVGAFVDPYGRATRRIMAVRARPPRRRYGGTRLPTASAATATGRLLGWIEEHTSLSLLLIKSGRQQNAPRFLGGVVFAFLAVFGVVFALDGVMIATGTAASLPIDLKLGLGFAVVVAAAMVVDLPRSVGRRQRSLDDALTECIVPLTIGLATGAMTNRLEALNLFAESLDPPTLAQFLLRPEAFGELRDETSRDYRTLIPDADRLADVELFRTIGDVYGLEVPKALSHSLHQTREQGRPTVDALSSVAVTFQTQKVDAGEERVESADRNVRLPMTLFIILVFAGILAPATYIVSQVLR
jgi:hypothetical protein